MSQENQTGFFRRYFIACFQPGKYKLLLEKKTGSHVVYFLLLLAFLLVVDTLIPFGAWTASVGGFRNLFLNRLPAFTLQDGTFESESPVSLEISGVLRVELNAEVEKYTEEDFNEEYQEEILVSRTNLLIRAGGQASELPLSALGDFYLDNQMLTAAIPALMIMLFFYFVITFSFQGGAVCRDFSHIRSDLPGGCALAGGKNAHHQRIAADRDVCPDAFFCHWQRQRQSRLSGEQFLGIGHFDHDHHELYI